MPCLLGRREIRLPPREAAATMNSVTSSVTICRPVRGIDTSPTPEARAVGVVERRFGGPRPRPADELDRERRRRVRPRPRRRRSDGSVARGRCRCRRSCSRRARRIDRRGHAHRTSGRRDESRLTLPPNMKLPPPPVGQDRPDARLDAPVTPLTRTWQTPAPPWRSEPQDPPRRRPAANLQDLESSTHESLPCSGATGLSPPREHTPPGGDVCRQQRTRTRSASNGEFKEREKKD